jgi:membrane-associated phospholipid phosphatase
MARIPTQPFSPAKSAELLRRGSSYRRPILVTALVLAIALFLTWLPPGQRREILLAIVARRSFILAILLFTLVSLSLLWARGQNLDNKVFLFVNLWGYRPKWLDGAMWVVTQIGGGWTALLLGAGLLLARQANLALEIVLGTLSLALLVEGLKELTNRARPYLIHAEARVIGWRAPGRSFPSGHTSQAFFLMTLLNFLWGAELPLTIALYATAVAVGITRMYVGAHFPRDVVGGSILGMAWGIFFILIDPFWHTWFVF